MTHYFKIITLLILSSNVLQASQNTFNEDFEKLLALKNTQNRKVEQLHQELIRLAQKNHNYQSITKLFEEENLIESANSFVPLTLLNFLQIQEIEKKEAILNLEKTQWIRIMSLLFYTTQRQFIQEQSALHQLNEKIEFLKFKQNFQHLKCQHWQCFSPEYDEQDRSISPLKLLPNIDQ